MLFNKKYLITNGSSQKKISVNNILILYQIINFNINSFVPEEDWLSILNYFQEDSSHFERVQHCYDLILKIYKISKLKRTSIISNSLIIFHKYYIYSFFTNSSISINIKEDLEFNKDLAYITMACFFISLKTSNCLLPSKFIIDTFCLFEKIDSDEEKLKIKEKIFSYEADILYTIHFSTEYEMPYPFLKKILGIGDQAVLKLAIKKSENNKTNTNINTFLLNFDNDADKIKHIKDKIAEIVNYSFLFPFFLNYDTKIISLSCLILAFKRLNIQINITDIINVISNQKETEIVSIDINDIEICSSLIDELVLSKIKKVPHQEVNNINNINTLNKQNFLNINNNENNIDTKSKNESKEKAKEETFLQKKRK